LATGKENLEIAKLLLEGGASPQRPDAGGLTPFHYAAMMNDVRTMDFAIRQRRHIDLEPLSQDGYSPLGIATYLGHMDMTSLLVEHGASLTRTT
jgi:ankyrin repeat protein